jgi:hypothetical protein
MRLWSLIGRRLLTLFPHTGPNVITCGAGARDGERRTVALRIGHQMRSRGAVRSTGSPPISSSRIERQSKTECLLPSGALRSLQASRN